ncbi:MAG: Rid family hydrolase [Acidimicrobiales bacterium]
MNDEERNAGLSRTPGYQYAQVVGDQLFIAGQVPLDGSGDLVGVDEPRQQATACLDNMRTLLGVHGFGIEHVRHITIHVVGRHEQLLRAWEAVVEWFGGEVPPQRCSARISSATRDNSSRSTRRFCVL